MSPSNLAALTALTAVAAAAPCLWDKDTLLQERARFPSAHELILGRFPRHSDAYYRWRIDDRQARRAAGERGPEVFDDLAVAWSKLGEDRRALELMDEKEALHPGLYETLANRGTFLIHAGELEQGAEWIAKAIEVNPDAHFGREVYQELLVRYVLHRREVNGSASLPLNPAADPYGDQDFWAYVRDALEVEEEQTAAAVQAAVKGVLGMMRFGNHDSPVLLEALADLLHAGRYDADAKRLCARALLKASYGVEDEDARAAYRKKAERALVEQTPTPREHQNLPLADLERRFREELAEAEEWWGGLRRDELDWIDAGVDVDAHYAEKYYAAAPDMQHRPEEERRASLPLGTTLVLAAFLGTALIAVLALVLARRGRTA